MQQFMRSNSISGREAIYVTTKSCWGWWHWRSKPQSQSVSGHVMVKGKGKGKGLSDHYPHYDGCQKLSNDFSLVRLSQSSGSPLDMLTSNPNASTHICHNYLFASTAHVWSIDLQCLHRWSIGTSGTSRNGAHLLMGQTQYLVRKLFYTNNISSLLVYT